MVGELWWWGLAVTSFLAATVLPLSSEAVLVGVLVGHPERLLAALTVASIGNTLGSLTSYGIGRLLPSPKEQRGIPWVQRYGVWALLLAWLPVVGDSLCVAAGWLRLPAGWSALAIAVGKVLRYAAVVGLMQGSGLG